MKKVVNRALQISLILGLWLPVQLALPFEWQASFVSAAWADDDDDDNDNDNDDNGSGSRGGGRSSGERPIGGFLGQLFNRPRQTQTIRPPSPAVLTIQAPSEIVVLDATAEELEQLLSEGFAIDATVNLDALDQVLTRLSVPEDLDLETARNRVRSLPSGANADFNHFYRFEQKETPENASDTCSHENCPAWEMIEWPRIADRTVTCSVSVPVGMIDTGINSNHEIMSNARLELIQLSDQSLAPSKAIHGTAVASLMVGDPNSRVPGLIHGAEVIAVDAFARQGADERADLVSLLRGLDLLKGRGVRVINLSLAGPNNSVLEEIVRQLVEEDQIVLVAAAGNSGPSGKPAFPAAFDGVLAVTAVDARARVYRQAQRGPHIDLTAPGVNMLSATSIRGARPKSGTSFAVPFVTAAVAIMLSQDETLTPVEVRTRLLQSARDLGAPGFDDIFGHGLLNTGWLC